MTSDNTVGRREQAVSFKTEVKLQMVRLNLSVVTLAHKLGLSRTAVSTAINHETMLPTVKLRIKEALGL